jgi:hypothetical protein
MATEHLDRLKETYLDGPADVAAAPPRVLDVLTELQLI